MSCSTTVVKYLVFVFNLLFAIIGLGILIVGVLLKTQSGAIENTVSDHVSVDVVPVVIIIVGAFVFITAFFGCCGSIKESTCMLTTFAIILLTLLIIQVAIGVYAFVQQDVADEAKTGIKQAVQQMVNQYNTSAEGSNTIDELQQALHCCGVDGPYDWKWSGERIPKSCCSHNEEDCTLSSFDKFSEGCASTLYGWLKRLLQTLGIVAVTIAAIELIGAVFALCLASSIRNQIRRGAYA